MGAAKAAAAGPAFSSGVAALISSAVWAETGLSAVSSTGGAPGGATGGWFARGCATGLVGWVWRPVHAR